MDFNMEYITDKDIHLSVDALLLGLPDVSIWKTMSQRPENVFLGRFFFVLALKMHITQENRKKIVLVCPEVFCIIFDFVLVRQSQNLVVLPAVDMRTKMLTNDLLKKQTNTG